MPIPARLVAFDLDDTLAPSKSPLPERMAFVLARLLDEVPVAIISGGQFGQFKTQVIDRLTAASEVGLSQLYLMPATGTQHFRYQGGEWVEQYAENLSEEDKKAALAALETKAREFGYWEEHTWGPILEDRGSQITFSALGQEAPVAEKKAWDPGSEKKNRLAAAVQGLFPELSVRAGGSTSIDITAKGIDKAYGMRKLNELTGVPLSDMLFIGDRLDPDGNDFPVVATGAQTHAVTGWEDTADYLEQLLGTIGEPRFS